MITHDIPSAGAASKTAGDARAGRAFVPRRQLPALALAPPEQPARPLQGRYGSVRVPLHLAARCQGPGVDPGAVPGGLGARWLRGPLLLPDARPAGARRWWQRVAQGNRDADRALSALFGGARAVLGRALWHQRSAQDRRRGAGDADRAAQVACRDQGRGRVCRPRPQVSDLGAQTLRRGTRGGHREGPRPQAAAGRPESGGRTARSAGMMAGSGGGAVAGGLARHVPVLGRSALEWLKPRDGGVYLDATFGAGGYTRAILAAANCQVIAIDRDRHALARGAELVQAAAGRLILVEGRFSDLQTIARECG